MVANASGGVCFETGPGTLCVFLSEGQMFLADEVHEHGERRSGSCWLSGGRLWTDGREGVGHASLRHVGAQQPRWREGESS